MEAKWPFFVLLFFFLFLTGYLVSQLERGKVMRNWDKRRCDLSVMMAARFFKPDEDPRTPSAFSTDNMEFCTKKMTESFMATLMAPFTMLLGKQAGLTGSAAGALSQVREVTQRIYTAFKTYLDSFLAKYKRSIVELRRVMIYMRMGVERMIAVALSTMYMGMTLFRGMVNAIQAVIRVILIVCAIMIAVIIILWFVLFPVMPVIMTTLTAIVALVGALSAVMSSSLAGEAESKKGGFCFSGDTLVAVSTEDGKTVRKRVHEVRVGDHIKDGGKVTVVMEMTSENIEWYSLEGILVSGDHLVQSAEGVWQPVKEDARAQPIPAPHVSRVYCFNTTTHIFPIEGVYGTVFLFRDWEELAEEDEEGHRLWDQMVRRMLGEVDEDRVSTTCTMEAPLWGGDTEVHTTGGWMRIQDVKVDDLLLDGKGHPQRVLGIVAGETHGPTFPSATGAWNTGRYEWSEQDRRWVARCPVDYPLHPKPITGYHVITATGEWVCRMEKGEQRLLRDFTEVGYQRLCETYPFILSRLRTGDKLYALQ